MVDFHTILIIRAFLARWDFITHTIMDIGDILITAIMRTRTSTIIGVVEVVTPIFIAKGPEVADL
jgi:hypothetical protein